MASKVLYARVFEIEDRRWVAVRESSDKVLLRSPNGVQFEAVTFEQARRIAERVEGVRVD